MFLSFLCMRQPCGKYGEYDLGVHLCAQPLDGSFGQPQGTLGLLAAYEKDKAGAAALLTDFRAVAAAGLRQSPHAPVQGIAAQRALRLAEAAIQRLGAQVNPKIVLSVFAAKFRAL